MGEKGLGTDPGVVGTGVPDAGAVGGSVPAGKTMGHDSWDPGPGVGKVSSDSGGLAGKSASLNVSASPGGTQAGRGIGSPMGGSADRGAVKTIDGLEHESEVVEYHDGDER